MRLYAHWLDGEYIRLTKPARPRLSEDIDRLIKLHALFGNTILLSDIQAIDSPIIQRLFASESFRNYVQVRRDLFELSARPVDLQGSDDPTLIAAAGLTRAARGGWTSSSLPSPLPIIEMAKAVLESGRGPDSLAQITREVSARWPQHELQLRGIKETFQYFSTIGTCLAPPSSTHEASYFDVLRHVREIPTLLGQHAQSIDDTIQFVEDHIPESDRYRYRAAVVRKLYGPDWRPLDRTVEPLYFNIVNAWNYAVQASLGAQGASVGYLRGSVPLAAYLDRPTDTLVPVTGTATPDYLGHRPVILNLDWDPAAVPWTRMVQIVSETLDTREAFQAALVSDDSSAIADALRAPVLVLVGKMVPESKRRIPTWVWVVSESVLVVFGQIEIVGGVELARRPVKEVVQRLRTHHLTNTLTEAGRELSKGRTHFHFWP